MAHGQINWQLKFTAAILVQFGPVSFYLSSFPVGCDIVHLARQTWTNVKTRRYSSVQNAGGTTTHMGGTQDGYFTTKTVLCNDTGLL